MCKSCQQQSKTCRPIYMFQITGRTFQHGHMTETSVSYTILIICILKSRTKWATFQTCLVFCIKNDVKIQVHSFRDIKRFLVNNKYKRNNNCQWRWLNSHSYPSMPASIHGHVTLQTEKNCKENAWNIYTWYLSGVPSSWAICEKWCE